MCGFFLKLSHATKMEERVCVCTLLMSSGNVSLKRTRSIVLQTSVAHPKGTS